MKTSPSRTLHLSPHDAAFVQDPYPAYAQARARGPVLYWEDYGMWAAFDAATVQALLRDRRLGREVPEELRSPVPDHMRDFYAVEHHSMLEREPPAHTRLRGMVLRAFTSARVRALGPEIETVARDLARALPAEAPFDLIPAYCTQIPVRIIARLLGVPEAMWPDLLRWSNAMVAVYQAGCDHAGQVAANAAAADFSAFLRGYVDKRRRDPRDDLITRLIAAEAEGSKLSTDALIGTCILLLNAGHEATVHALGNGVACLLGHAPHQGGGPASLLGADHCAATVEELLRYNPPLHVFERFAYEDVDLDGATLRRGDKIALVLGAAGRDPAICAAPDQFDPRRPARPHAAFGGGLHFCVGAPLARLELQIALRVLFDHAPALRLAAPPRYADSYHFHKLDRLMVTR